MKSAIRSTLAACLALIGTASLHAQTSFVPQGMSYQGFLTDENGNPVANAAPENRNVQFRVYSQATGGTALWGEEQTVTVFKGNFSVILGNGSAISGISSGPLNFTNLFTEADSENRFFGITPAGGPEFAPRQRILSSAYALRSRVAESVTQTSGFSIFPEVRSTGQIKLTSTGQAGQIELGSGVVGKEQYAGTISYQGHSNGLDIVGAGNTTESRVITMWAEGGTEFKGPISFGDRIGQHINLYNADYGIGIQDNTLYLRTANHFAWYRNGTHNAATLNPGTNGTHLATLNQTGFNLQTGAFTGNGSGLTNLPPATSANNFTVTGTQGFGSRHGQHLNLWGTAYAFGIQHKTLYSRVEPDARFSWYAGGTHSGTTNDPGEDGTLIANWNAERVEFNRKVTMSQTLDVNSFSQRHYNGEWHAFFRLFPTDSGHTAFSNVWYTDENNPLNVSIQASHGIVGHSLYARSDSRIKQIDGISDATADLETISALEVTDYFMKDTVTHGIRKSKKLIAQQVEQVYPQAVSLQTGVVPDIFTKATAKDDFISLTDGLPEDLAIGDTVRVLSKDSEILSAVTKITPEGFSVEEVVEDGEVFVYGREVDDLRIVDYDAIAMLNVSATQELLRRLEAQEKLIERLQQEKSEMSKEVANLREQSTTQDERLARLESLLNTVAGASGSSSPVAGASGSPSPNPNLNTVEPISTLAR